MQDNASDCSVRKWSKILRKTILLFTNIYFLGNFQGVSMECEGSCIYSEVHYRHSGILFFSFKKSKQRISCISFQINFSSLQPSLLNVLDSSSGSFFARFCSKEYLPLEPSNCFSKDSVPKQIVDSFTSMKNVTYDRVSTSMIRPLRFGNLIVQVHRKFHHNMLVHGIYEYIQISQVQIPLLEYGFSIIIIFFLRLTTCPLAFATRTIV